MTRAMPAIAGAAAACLIIAVAPRAAGAYRLVERLGRTLEAGERPRLFVENVHGSIEVRGWDRDSIEVGARVTIRAASRHKAERIFEGLSLETARGGGAVRVRMTGGDPRMDALSGEGNTTVLVAYTIQVPRRCVLEIVSVTGDVSAAGVEGEFSLESRAGDVRLRSRGGDGLLRSVGGSIWCRLGSLGPGGLDIATTNGSVDLRIPAAAGAGLDALSDGGRVRVSLPLSRTGKRTRSRIEGTIGDGGPEISIRTTSGSIDVGPLDGD